MEERKPWRLFCFALYSVVFLLMLELAASGSFHLLEAAVLALGAAFLLLWWRHCRFSASRWWEEIRRPLGRLWWVPVLTAVYLAADMASFLYGPGREFAWQKYRAALPFAFTGACICTCCRGRGEREKVLKAVCWASAVSGAAAWVSIAFGGAVIPLCYSWRMTLRRDYNMFAVALLSGMFTSVYLAAKKPTPARIWASALLWAELLPAVWLSGSRRALLMLIPGGAVLLGVLLQRAGKESREALRRAMLAAAAAAAAAVLLTLLAQALMEKRYEQQGPVAAEDGGGTTAAQRYETAVSGGLFSKRSLIWRTALREAASYRGGQVLFGKGGGWNILLYDTVDVPELKEAYAHLDGAKGLLSAHSFLLADYLEGGLLRLLCGVAALAGYALAALVLLRADGADGAFYGIMLAVILADNLVSNRFGLLYDRMFWIFPLCMLFTLAERRDLT